MKHSFSSRRAIIVGGAAFGAMLIVPKKAFAGRFRDAVINFIEKNYDNDIESMAEENLQDLVGRVLPVEDVIEDAPSDLQEHVDDTWGSGRGSKRHTERCPYCISVAQEVESRASDLTPVDNRVPKCFIINGAPYIASDWGTLHRYLNGQTGPAEGFIWFVNGQYVGVGYDGTQFYAQPAC